MDTASVPCDVITIADLCADLILSGEDVVPEFSQVEKIVPRYALRMGGSCSIFACQCAKLGARTSVVGALGLDGFGDLIMATLERAGVLTDQVRRDEAISTGLTVILAAPDDRAMLTCLGGIDVVDGSYLSEGTLRGARHLHIGSYFLLQRLQPHLPQIARTARSLGLSISLDTNWDPANTWQSGLPQLLPLVDVLLPNEAEAMAIAGTSSVESAAEALAQIVDTVVIKRGRHGALIRQGDTAIAVDSPAVDVVDTVGAGDSFDAGFIASHLRGESLEQSARCACICGALSTRAAGGEEGQATREEVMRELERLGG